MFSADGRSLARRQEEDDTQDIDNAQKQKPSKGEMKEKIDEFMHVALHEGNYGESLIAWCYVGVPAHSRNLNDTAAGVDKLRTVVWAGRSMCARTKAASIERPFIS